MTVTLRIGTGDRWCRLIAVPGLQACCVFRVLLLAVFAVCSGCGGIINWVGGNFAGSPADMARAVSSDARELIERAMEGIDPARRIDLHVHLSARDLVPAVRSSVPPPGPGSTRSACCSTGST